MKIEFDSLKGIFVYGRMNPPTKGHQMVVEHAKKLGLEINAPVFVFCTKTTNSRNPLTFSEKTGYLKEFFNGVHIVTDYNGTLFGSIDWLIMRGYTELYMVAGEDRIKNYTETVTKYIPKLNPHVKEQHALHLDKFAVIEAGKRNIKSEGIDGISATKARDYAINGLKKEFLNIIPDGNDTIKEQLYDNVRGVLINGIGANQRE